MIRLKQLRTENDVNQYDVAKLLDVTRQAYSRYEREERELGYDMLCKLADYFNVSVDYLIGHETKKNLIMERPLSDIAEDFIREYSDLFSDKTFRAYAELYRIMDTSQRIFAIGMIVGYLKEKGINININY